MSRAPKFRIVNAGHRYHLYLGQGHRLVKNFGKIAENCTTTLGLRYTLLRFPMRSILNLHFSKGLNFFNSFSHNSYFERFVEPRWLKPFQRVFSFPKKMAYHESLVNAHITTFSATKFSRYNPLSPAIYNCFDDCSFFIDQQKFPHTHIDGRRQRGVGHPFGTHYYKSKSPLLVPFKVSNLKRTPRILRSWSSWIQFKLSSPSFSLRSFSPKELVIA
jgi:hypothetical protein